jgi:hypothetical protein
MSDDNNILVRIEGDEPATSRRTPTTTDTTLSETRRVFAERSAALNELRDAKVQENHSKQHLLRTKADAAQEAARNAWDSGEVDRMQTLQREAAALDAERIQVEAEGRRLESLPYLPPDPVEAFLSGRDAATQKWLRDHPDEAVALATNSDPRRVAKLNAADADAIAEGHKSGSASYFEHVEGFLGMRNGKRGDRADKHLKAGQLPKAGQPDTVKLTKREYELATDGTIVWESGPNKGKAIGAVEYIRRRRIMDNAPEWQRLDG